MPGVHDRLANAGQLEAVGGIAYIAALGDGYPRIPPVGQWAQLIRDKARLREVLKLAANLLDKAFNQTDGATHLLGSAIESLSTLAREIDGDKDEGMTYREAAGAANGRTQR